MLPKDGWWMRVTGVIVVTTGTLLFAFSLVWMFVGVLICGSGDCDPFWSHGLAGGFLLMFLILTAICPDPDRRETRK